MDEKSIAHLRELAEAATLNDDPGDWPIPEAVGWDRDEDNQFVAALSPKLVIALIDRLGELERMRGETEWEYVAAARKGYVSGEPRIHVRSAIQAYEEELDQVVFEQEDETPVVFKRRAAGPWEPV